MFPSAEYTEYMDRQASLHSWGYALGAGGQGVIAGLHLSFNAWELDSGAGLTLRPLSRLNVGRQVDRRDGLFDPIWYNGGQMFWRFPLQAGIFRVYIGVSAWSGWRPSPKADPEKCYLPHKPCGDMGRTLTFAAGAFSGIEFFMFGRSYYLELGSQDAANPNAMDGGIYVATGSNFFFGD